MASYRDFLTLPHLNTELSKSRYILELKTQVNYPDIQAKTSLVYRHMLHISP